jgi:hypothetical protein
VIDLVGACRRHRADLLDFVDRGAVTDTTSAALAHLDRCSRCTAELETTILAITAVRRLGDEAARAEPAADAWPRLRARLDRWRPVRWAIMSPTTGMVMSAAIVAVLIAPMRIGGAATTSSPAPAPDRDVSSIIERRVEADYIASIREGTLSGPDLVVRPAGIFPRNYPDGIRPERKEVSPTEPSGHPPEAI